MIRSVADTHALIWYVDGDPRLSAAAKAEFEAGASSGGLIAVPSITLAEMVYLVEKRKIAPDIPGRIVSPLALDDLLTEIPVDRDIVASMETIPRGDVPDMPDRIIAATALFLGVPLISKDRKIQSSQVVTIW